MRHFAALLWALTAAAILSWSQSGNQTRLDKKPADSKAEREVVASIQSRLDALKRRDYDAWASHVDDDLLAPLERDTKSKQALLRGLQSWPAEVKYWYGPLEDMRVRIHGDTAVAAYRAKQYNEIGGQITYVQRWQVETFLRSGKFWKLVAVADGLIPQEPVSAKLNSAVYDAYVGQYEWAPTLVATVSKHGDKLMHQLGGPELELLLPENEETFFIPGEAATGSSSRYIFVRDSTGRVTHYIYRELGGTDRIVKKIK